MPITANILTDPDVELAKPPRANTMRNMPKLLLLAMLMACCLTTGCSTMARFHDDNNHLVADRRYYATKDCSADIYEHMRYPRGGNPRYNLGDGGNRKMPLWATITFFPVWLIYPVVKVSIDMPLSLTVDTIMLPADWHAAKQNVPPDIFWQKVFATDDTSLPFAEYQKHYNLYGARLVSNLCRKPYNEYFAHDCHVGVQNINREYDSKLLDVVAQLLQHPPQGYDTSADTANLANQPHLLPETFGRLYDLAMASGKPAVLESMAKNPETPQEYLIRLAESTPSLGDILAANPSLPPQQLKALYETSPGKYDLALAGNKATPGQILAAIYKSTLTLHTQNNSGYDFSIARAIQSRLLSNLTLNPGTPPETIRELFIRAQHPDAEKWESGLCDRIMEYIAVNPSTPAEILSDFYNAGMTSPSDDKKKNLMPYLAQNPALPPEKLKCIFSIAFAHHDDYVLRRLASNPGTPPECLTIICRDAVKTLAFENENIPERLSKNQSLPTQALVELAAINLEHVGRDSAMRIYKNIMNHPAVTPAVLLQLQKSIPVFIEKCKNSYPELRASAKKCLIEISERLAAQANATNSKTQ